jgi:hypothetical protein
MLFSLLSCFIVLAEVQLKHCNCRSANEATTTAMLQKSMRSHYKAAVKAGTHYNRATGQSPNAASLSSCLFSVR